MVDIVKLFSRAHFQFQNKLVTNAAEPNLNLLLYTEIPSFYHRVEEIEATPSSFSVLEEHLFAKIVAILGRHVRL